MIQNSLLLQIKHKDQEVEYLLDGSSYHEDKLLPLLNDMINSGKKVCLELYIKDKLEIDLILVTPNFEEIVSFVKSYPRMKLHRSLQYFVPRVNG